MKIKFVKKETSLTFIIPAFCLATVVFIILNLSSALFMEIGKPALILLIKILLTAYSLFIFSIFALERRNNVLLSKETQLLAQSEQRCRLLEEFSDNVHFDADLIEDRIYFNSNFECLFGQKPGVSILSNWRNLLGFIALDDLQLIISAWKKVIDFCQQSTAEIRIIDADGQMLWYRLNLVAQYNSDGKAVRVLGRLSNIDTQMRQIRRLRLKSFQDRV